MVGYFTTYDGQPGAKLFRESIALTDETHFASHDPLLESPHPLTTSEALFSALDKNDVRYCHWKSNEHLDAGLAGETDLDVLVDRSHHRRWERILADHGFKRFTTAEGYSRPPMTDYLGFDRETGSLIHLHTHYQLVLGSALKEYQVPWGEDILSSRVQDQETGVYTIDPTFELVLLLVRAAFKSGGWDKQSEDSSAFPPDDIMREYRWLRSRTSVDDVVCLSGELLDQVAMGHVRVLLEQDLSPSALATYRGYLRDRLEPYQTYGRMARYVKQKQAIIRKVKRHLARTYDLPYHVRRGPATGGMVIAVIGADGSGKSTMSSMVAEWLSSDLTVYEIYMGSDTGVTLPKRLLRRVKADVKQRGGSSSSQAESSSPNSGSVLKGVLRRPFRLASYLVDAHDKRVKLRRLVRARNRNAVVLTDRFPQNQVMGINDGPKLDSWMQSWNPLRRWLATWERKPFEIAADDPPDVVIKLLVDPETASRRSPHENAEQQREKCKIIDSLEFDDATVIEIDANRSRDAVAQHIKRRLWRTI